MSVSNGQIANAGTFNAAFMSRTVDTDTIGKVEFKNTTDAGNNVGSVRVQGGIYGAKKLYLVGQAQLLAGVAIDAAADNSATGSDQDITLAKPFIIFTQGSLTSIRNLTLTAGMTLASLIVLKNGQTGDLILKNNTGGTAANRILTGTGQDLTISAGACVFLIYDFVNSRWQVVGGTGSGGAGTIPSGTDFVLPDFANTDITGMTFDNTKVRSAKVEYTVYRETTGVGANVRVQTGFFWVMWDGTDWGLYDGPFGGEAGTTFYVSNTATGQVAALTDAGTGTYDPTKSKITWQITLSTKV
jgi:hypothetical protein